MKQLNTKRQEASQMQLWADWLMKTMIENLVEIASSTSEPAVKELVFSKLSELLPHVDQISREGCNGIYELIFSSLDNIGDICKRG